jgi:hypothetical protein
MILPEGVPIAAGRIGAVPLGVHEEEQRCVASARTPYRTSLLCTSTDISIFAT